jgi:CO/xanthine dehydrogenase Mo-binding subunit
MPAHGPDPLLRAKRGLIGTPVSRLDGPLKVQGEARFAAEFALEGMLYAALALHDRVRADRAARHGRGRSRAGGRARHELPQRATHAGSGAVRDRGQGASPGAACR